MDPSGEILGTVTTNQAGESVLLPDTPPEPGSRELGPRSAATQTAETGTTGAHAPAGPLDTAPPSPEPAEAPARPSSRQTPESENATVADVPGPKPETGDEGTPAREGEGASRVLQQPREGGLSDRDLVLNAVDYDEAGRVIISGQATPGAVIFVHLDDKPLGRAVADQEGRWEAVPGKTVAPGLHSLRVDLVDGAGAVLASVETPFSQAALPTGQAKETFVVVQPGNSLWRIARRSTAAAAATRRSTRRTGARSATRT